MVNVEIGESYLHKVIPDLILRAANAVIHHQDPPENTDLTILITSDEQVRQLNYQFRDVDATTDVLAFPADFVDPETNSPYLGDVIISFPRALAQADERQLTVESELQLLVVHGILHLYGHDHSNNEEKTIMWAAQKKILADLGVNMPAV